MLLALAIVQFNGHLHRIKHSNAHGVGHVWLHSTATVDDHASGSPHYHNCALLDAASLGLGPVGCLYVQPTPVWVAVGAVAPASTRPLGVVSVKLPPARAPPLFS